MGVGIIAVAIKEAKRANLIPFKKIMKKSSLHLIYKSFRLIRSRR